MAYKPPPEKKTEWVPVAEIAGGLLAELHGRELARGRLYFAGVTHALRMPFRAGRIGPKLTVSGVEYEVGFGIDPDGSGRTVEVFLRLPPAVPEPS